MSEAALPINLQSNYPVLAEQEVHWTALLRGAVERFAPESLRLPAFGGSLALRAQAAGWLQMPVERTRICESGHHGTMAALLAAGLAGKTIAVEEVSYPWFMRQAEMLGCRVVPVALDAECMLPNALRAACMREKVSAVYTMPSLHNPTGAVASLARRAAIVDVAREFDLAIVEDAAYGFLLAEEPERYTVLAPERAFYVESLSKRVAPGLRTAFLVGPARWAAEVELALRVMASGSSTLLASLGCAMAADGSLAAVIAAKRREGAKRLAGARAILHGLAMMGGGNSWHVFVTLPDGVGTDEDVERACEERGVLTTGARWFTAPGAPVARAVRLGFGGETDWSRVAEGLQIFASVVRD